MTRPRVSISDGAILAHPQFDVTGLIRGQHESNFNDVLGFRYAGARGNEIYWVDPTMQQVQAVLDQQFPEHGAQIMDWTEGFGTVLFQVSGSDMPPSYYVLRDSRLTLLGNARPWLDQDDLPTSELIYYEARDGLRIPGILSTPAGWEPSDGPRPAIVLPHGGPWSRDSTQWDASGWVPFLTSRGYVVLQPQYRGSTNWGRELWLAGDGQWGLAMQDDKDDGGRLAGRERLCRSGPHGDLRLFLWRFRRDGRGRSVKTVPSSAPLPVPACPIWAVSAAIGAPTVCSVSFRAGP